MMSLAFLLRVDLGVGALGICVDMLVCHAIEFCLVPEPDCTRFTREARMKDRIDPIANSLCMFSPYSLYRGFIMLCLFLAVFDLFPTLF